MLGIPTEDDGFVQVAQLGTRRRRRHHRALAHRRPSRARSRRARSTSSCFPVRVLDDIVRAHPVVAREIVRESENRVQQARIALHAVGEQLPFGRRVLG